MSTQRNCSHLFSQLLGQANSNWTDEQKIIWRQILKNCFTPEISISWPKQHFLGMQVHTALLGTEVYLITWVQEGMQ